jgi:hypothetical protein
MLQLRTACSFDMRSTENYLTPRISMSVAHSDLGDCGEIIGYLGLTK